MAEGKALVLKRARQFHLWLGAFFAPLILFYAFSGLLQLAELHEAHPGQPAPATWIAKMAQLHKKQNVDVRARGEGPRDGSAEGRRPDADFQPRPQAPASFAFKAFSVFMAAGLILTTLLGLFMSFQFARDKRVTLILFVLGALLPIGMVVAM